MNNKARIRQRAGSIYTRMLTMRLEDEAEDWPVREPKRELAGTRLFGRYDEDWEFDPVHDPEFKLDRNLEEAEFTVLHDTGPEG